MREKLLCDIPRCVSISQLRIDSKKKKFQPGRVNPTVAFRYIDLTDSTNTWHTFAAPEKVTADHILNSVNWITDDLVGAFWLNRRQNLGSYQICSTSGDRSCNEVRFLFG